MGIPVILKRLRAAGKMGCPSADAVETRSQEGGTTTQPLQLGKRVFIGFLSSFLKERHRGIFWLVEETA